MHYARCAVGDCIAFSNATGLCKRHREIKPQCSIFGCPKHGLQKGMCTTHYARALMYGISAERMSELLARGKCDSCGEVTSKLNIDHDHSCCPSRTKICGKCVRGVLCQPCNQALGFLDDNPDKIIKLLEYLANY